MDLGSAALATGLRRAGFSAWDVGTPAGRVRIWQAAGRRGAGPTMVVLHGLGGSSVEYGSFLKQLREVCRKLIAVDMPGHGASTPVGRQNGAKANRMHRGAESFVGSINAALDNVIAEQVTLVGHSLGGYAAIRYALEGQARHWVTGLVLVSPDGAPFHADELATSRALFRVGSFTDAARLGRQIWPQHRIKARVMALFIRARFTSPAMRYLVNSDVFQPVVSPAQLQALPARTCLIWGKREACSPPHNLTYFKAHLPRTFELYEPDTGHGDLTSGPPELMHIFREVAAGLPLKY